MHKLLAKDLMTSSPVCIDIDQNMLSASQLMIEKNIRHLLVTHQGTVVGILSDRDVSRAIKAEKNIEGHLDQRLSNLSKVTDFMNWPVYTVAENASAKFVLQQLLTQKVSAFAVQNEKGKITGIITANDFLGHLLVLMQREDDRDEVTDENINL